MPHLHYSTPFQPSARNVPRTFVRLAYRGPPRSATRTRPRGTTRPRKTVAGSDPFASSPRPGNGLGPATRGASGRHDVRHREPGTGNTAKHRATESTGHAG